MSSFVISVFFHEIKFLLPIETCLVVLVYARIHFGYFCRQISGSYSIIIIGTHARIQLNNFCNLLTTENINGSISYLLLLLLLKVKTIYWFKSQGQLHLRLKFEKCQNFDWIRFPLIWSANSILNFLIHIPSNRFAFSTVGEMFQFSSFETLLDEVYI